MASDGTTSVDVGVDPLSTELYKSLRGELVDYLQKVPTLWLQKFVLTGAVIAFLAAGDTKGFNAARLLVPAIATIPILAMLLDIKMAEYALHVRALSLFIQQHFNSSIVARWEETLWGDRGDPRIISLVRLRSMTTVLVTAVPTSVLILLAGIAIGQVVPTARLVVVLAALATALLYSISVVLVTLKVWSRHHSRKVG